MFWSLTVLPALSAGAALLELDNVCVGQWMISRPIVAGPLFGALLGSVWCGVVFGFLFEAFSCEHFPLGGVLSINGCVSAVCGVLLSAGPAAVPWAASFAAATCLGLIHGRLIEPRLRMRRERLIQDIEGELLRGDGVSWMRYLARSLVPHAAATAALVYAAVAAGPLLRLGFSALPLSLRGGLNLAFGWMPWLGWAIFLDCLWRRRA